MNDYTHYYWVVKDIKTGRVTGTVLAKDKEEAEKKIGKYGELGEAISGARFPVFPNRVDKDVGDYESYN